jgi:queuine tRNA-ribosyltransferase
MSSEFAFRVLATDGAARCGEISTPHGAVRTPGFMPVGTQATVKAMRPEEVRASGTDIVLANTYHLALRPGAERIARLGGLHQFMNWPHAILTDSGGFQVMSLAPLRKLEANGVTFRSHLDGTELTLTPERAIEIQALLGADITMQLDDCIKLPAAPREQQAAMRLSLAWAERSKRAFATVPPGAALFGIAQGGDHKDLRQQSATALVDIGFDGYAIGGLAVGEPQHVMLAILEHTLAFLPSGQPRYLMGVGRPDDILQAVTRGVDLFDCVLPTRNGRHGLAFTRFGTKNLKNARYANAKAPLDKSSNCATARSYSRGYLHHLIKANETLAAMLLTEVNVYYYQSLLEGVRSAIGRGCLMDYVEELRANWARPDDAGDE